MSGELAFLDVDGIEIANAYRTLEYIKRLGSPKWQVPEVYPCSVLAREVGGLGPFTSPSVDPAPWYDSTIPESAEFLGLITKLDFQTLSVKRNISQRFGSLGGGVIGIEQVAGRGLHADAMLIATTCAGLEYGRHWIYSKLGSDCAGCALRTVRVRESCPPSNGTNDARGERIMYDAALVDGIKRSDDGGASCCDYDGITFDLQSQSPYLYNRAGAASAAQFVQGSGGFAPPPPSAVLDSGTRANTGPPPSASWTGSPYSGAGNNLKIISNQFAITPGASTGGAYWNAAQFGPDCAVMATLGTRGDVFGGSFVLFGRLTSPGLGIGSAPFMKVSFSSVAGGDFVTIGRINASGSIILLFGQPSGHTAAVGDRYMLTCRGNLIEAWHQIGGVGGTWAKLAAYYDPTTPAAGWAGIQINESGTSPGLTNFAASTLTNGSVFPKDVLTFSIPPISVGIVSPIVTLTAPRIDPSGPAMQDVAHGVRVQMKQATDCQQQDDFSTDTIAAGRWTQTPASSYQVTGGKLKPLLTGTSGGSGRRILRSKDTAGKTIAYLGGRAQATIKTGTVVTGGSWGVQFSNQFGAFLAAGGSLGTNVFALGFDANAFAVDSVAFTPQPSTTYLVIVEVLPLAVGYDVRGFLVDPATSVLLTRPLRATFGSVNPIVPPFQPGIGSIPVQTTEEWDSFYAIDYTDNATYIEMGIPGGTLVLDASRRVSRFTSAIPNSVSIDGSAYLSSPLNTPLGWPDLCAGQGWGCLQVFGDDTALYLSTVSVAMQQRMR